MKLIKIALSTIALIILLIIAAVVLLPQFINPNDYKAQITDTIEQKTGLEATIDGDLSLSVFPWLGVSTGHIVLKQPTVIQQSASKAGDFVDVQAIDIKVKLIPLLSRKIEVDTILLQQPRIEFVVNSAGKNSLAGLSQTSSSKSSSNEVTQATNTTTAASAEPAAIAAFTIAGVNINDGRFIFDDQQTNSRYELTDLNVNSGNILETTAPLSISGALTGKAIETTTFSLNSEVNINKDTMAVALNNLRSSIVQGTNTVDAEIESINFQQANATAAIEEISIDGTFENTPISLSIPSMSADINKALVNIPAFTVNSSDITLSGNVDIKDWNKVPIIVGDIQSNTVNLQSTLKKFGIDYVPTNSSALTKVSFSSHFNATTNGAALQKTQITIDKTVLTGDVAIIDFSQPKYRFDLALNEIIIDDYLPVATDDSNTANNDKALTATEALAAPIILLKDIYANGTFKANKITANKIKLTNSIINIASTDSTVTITPTVDLYDGKLAGSTILQRGKSPTLLIKNTLTGVNLEPLLTDAEVSDQLSGIANINTNIVVSEKSGEPSSKGTIVLSVKNGAIKGVDIKKVLDDAQATIDKIRGKSVNQDAESNTDETRFAEMSATLLINNDIVTNNDLSMKAPAFRINGQGTVNTAAQTLDYLTSIVIVNTNSGQGGENLNDLKGFTIPVRFTGPLASPKYAIDTKALLKANAGKELDEKKAELKAKADAKKAELKAKADEKKAKLKEKANEKLKESGKKLFDKLF